MTKQNICNSKLGRKEEGMGGRKEGRKEGEGWVQRQILKINKTMKKKKQLCAKFVASNFWCITEGELLDIPYRWFMYIISAHV